MTPYALECGDFVKSDLDLLRDATTIVDAIPEPPKGWGPWRCHEIARVVGTLLKLRVVDCSYGAMEHSVLFLRDAIYARTGHCAVILDPYCPGRMPQVQLVYLFIGTPQAAMYKSTKPRTDIRETHVKWLIKELSK